MKKTIYSLMVTFLLASGTVFSQTLAEVINEFNAAAKSLNEQAYESALAQFNTALEMCDAVGEEADDMKKKTQEQIVGTHYREARTLMKRRQYGAAIPSLENTVKYSAEYGVKEEFGKNALKYLPKLYLLEGNVLLKEAKYDESIEIFDKVLAMEPDTYEAHMGKGLVYKEQDEITKMLEEFDIAKTKAISVNDADVVDKINGAIDGHFRGLIEEELMMIDEEEPDYTFLLDIVEQALAANDKNGYAYWQAAVAYNKMVEYDKAIEYAEKGVQVEQDPILVSALYFELGKSYQNTVRYDDACEAYNKVTEEPFFSKAEKKMTASNCN